MVLSKSQITRGSITHVHHTQKTFFSVEKKKPFNTRRFLNQIFILFKNKYIFLLNMDEFTIIEFAIKILEPHGLRYYKLPLSNHIPYRARTNEKVSAHRNCLATQELHTMTFSRRRKMLKKYCNTEAENYGGDKAGCCNVSTIACIQYILCL